VGLGQGGLSVGLRCGSGGSVFANLERGIAHGIGTGSSLAELESGYYRVESVLGGGAQRVS
jgi:hypothetical protein